MKAGFLATSVSKSQNSVSSRLAIARSITDLAQEGYCTQDLMTLIKILLQDKDSEVKTETRRAIDELAKNNKQAEELVTKWMPKGDQQSLALEIVRNGASDFISPRKIRMTTLQKAK
jgi:ATP-dependent protease Clp ATPase subunit